MVSFEPANTPRECQPDAPTSCAILSCPKEVGSLYLIQPSYDVTYILFIW